MERKAGQGCQVGIFHAKLQEFGIFLRRLARTFYRLASKQKFGIIWHLLVHDKNIVT